MKFCNQRGGASVRLVSFLGLAALGAFVLGTACTEPFSTCEEKLNCADGNPNASGGAGGGTNGVAGSGNSTGGTSPQTCADLECTAPTARCDEEELKCVGCLETEHCTEATASVCDAGECTVCSGNEDCGHIEGKGICLEGECVECTVADESACGENSCNPATNTCTTTKRGMTGRCLPCVADSECEENYRCVPMAFQGEPREGGYCLKDAATSCSRPFTVPIPPRVSLSGAFATAYCGVSEDSTTCEAVLGLLNDAECPGGEDAECGAPGLNDGRCEVVNFVVNRCTYSCDASSQCPNTFQCGSDANDYCGFVNLISGG